MKRSLRWACLVAFLVVTIACGQSEGEQSLEVTATAYTMAESETKKGNVGLAAWGDQLEPGMKAIAVSRDLIEMGLDHETEVRIEGLEGTYVVRDKMNKRWEKKIDIFMGKDREKAMEWGKKTVTIIGPMSQRTRNDSPISPAAFVTEIRLKVIIQGQEW